MKSKMQENSVREKVIGIYSMSGGRGISSTGVKNLSKILKVAPEEIQSFIDELEGAASDKAEG